MLMSGELEQHISDILIPTYRGRYESMIEAIKEHLYPLGFSLSTGTPYLTSSQSQDSSGKPIQAQIQGGFFLYITFPQDGSLPLVSKIAEIALENFALRMAPGHIFAVKGVDTSQERALLSYGNGVRLCWAWNEEEVRHVGIFRLAGVIKSFTDSKTILQILL